MILMKIMALYTKFVSLALTFFASTILSMLVIVAYYWIHEFGHMIFGFFYNLALGKIASFHITSWVDLPFFGLILKVPQQTTIINGVSSAFFVYGGIIFGLSVMYAVSFYLFKKVNNRGKIIIAFMQLVFILFEVVGNYLCGTDNYAHTMLIDCSYAQLIPENMIFLLLIPTMFLIFNKVDSAYMKWLKSAITYTIRKR